MFEVDAVALTQILFWMIVLLSSCSFAIIWLARTSFVMALAALVIFFVNWVWLAGAMGIGMAALVPFGVIAFVTAAIGAWRLRHGLAGLLRYG